MMNGEPYGSAALPRDLAPHGGRVRPLRNPRDREYRPSIIREQLGER